MTKAQILSSCSIVMFCVLRAGLARAVDGGTAPKDPIGAPAAAVELSHEHKKAIHGMVVFGKDSIYLYHLPLWQGVHSWQLVIEVELHGGTEGDAAAIYAGDRAQGSKLNTFQPVPGFALESLAPAFSFTGTLYHGHFEQRRQPIATKVTVLVKRIVMLKKLNPEDAALDVPTYRVFGAGKEWYAAHVASHKPDFDQVVALEPAPGAVTTDRLAFGVGLTLPGRPNTLDGRPQRGAQLSGQLDGGASLPFNVTNETYFNTSDLGNQ